MPSSDLASVVLPARTDPRAADHWLSLAEVRRALGAVSGSTIYRLMARDPSFPRPVQIFSGNRWSAKELAVWMEAQLAARPPQDR